MLACIVLQHGLGGVDVYEKTKRVTKSVKHLIKFVEVFNGFEVRRMTLECPNCKVVCNHSKSRVLSWDMENDVRSLDETMPGALLIFHFKNGAIGYQSKTI